MRTIGIEREPKRFYVHINCDGRSTNRSGNYLFLFVCCLMRAAFITSAYMLFISHPRRRTLAHTLIHICSMRRIRSEIETQTTRKFLCLHSLFDRRHVVQCPY